MMEKQIKEAFENLKMSDECAENIKSTLNDTDIHPRSGRFTPIAIAACLLLVIFVFTNSTAVAALETVGENIKDVIASLFYPEAEVEEQHEFEGGNLVIESGKKNDDTKYNVVQYNTRSTPSWLEATGNGLYVLADGKRIEISGLISNETPYTYIFTGQDEIRHYIAVGGTYSTEGISLETVYWAEWFQKPPYDYRSWLGGYSKGNYDNRNECEFGWYVKAKEILDVPY